MQQEPLRRNLEKLKVFSFPIRQQETVRDVQKETQKKLVSQLGDNGPLVSLLVFSQLFAYQFIRLSYYLCFSCLLRSFFFSFQKFDRIMLCLIPSIFFVSPFTETKADLLECLNAFVVTKETLCTKEYLNKWALLRMDSLHQSWRNFKNTHLDQMNRDFCNPAIGRTLLWAHELIKPKATETFWFDDVVLKSDFSVGRVFGIDKDGQRLPDYKGPFVEAFNVWVEGVLNLNQSLELFFQSVPQAFSDVVAEAFALWRQKKAKITREYLCSENLPDDLNTFLIDTFSRQYTMISKLENVSAVLSSSAQLQAEFKECLNRLDAARKLFTRKLLTLDVHALLISAFNIDGDPYVHFIYKRESAEGGYVLRSREEFFKHIQKDFLAYVYGVAHGCVLHRFNFSSVEGNKFVKITQGNPQEGLLASAIFQTFAESDLKVRVFHTAI